MQYIKINQRFKLCKMQIFSQIELSKIQNIFAKVKQNLA